MKFIFSASLLLMCVNGYTSSPKIYRCQQADGSMVIQDIRCIATSLKKAPAKATSSKLKSVKSNKKVITKSASRIKRAVADSRNKNKLSRSPYFTFGWSNFIPANWSSQQQSNQYFEETYWSRDILTSPSDFKKGVKLRAYRNTMGTRNVVAFAQALDLYHGIRDNADFTLIDSQFKTHQRFKVFNLKYQQPQGLLTTTEFYIDETFNDLFVVTVQAKEAELLTQWQLANQIIENL